MPAGHFSSDVSCGIPTQTVVVRQNLSRDQDAAVLGRVVLNTIIDSIPQEDSGGHELECVEDTYI